MPRLFDTHCHLAGKEMLPHAKDYIERAAAAGVQGMTIIAADRESLTAARDMAQRFGDAYPALKIFASAGVHPHDAKNIDEALWAQIEECAETARAIGETGLDYHYEFSDRKVQQEYFARHISLSVRSSKALVIHCREAATDVLSMLQNSKELRGHPRPGILHCFSEDQKMAHALLDLDFYISFSGILTFKNAEPLRKVAQTLPLERILIETDSPWLAPIPYRGKNNEPAYVSHVFEQLCQLRSESREEIENILWLNSCRVFGEESGDA